MKIKLVMMIMALGVLMMSGCSVSLNTGNGNNTASNSNSATNSNANANTTANANTAQTFKNDLLGTWIGVDDPKKKVTFAADEMTLVEDGKENKLKYTRLSNDEMEVIVDGNKKKAKTTFEGDVLTIASNETVKFKRESANATNNSAANANTSASNTATNTATAPKEEVPLTEEAKVLKNNLVGKWEYNTHLYTFTENKIEHRTKGDDRIVEELSFRILDEKTAEIVGYGKVSFTFEDNGNTLVWTTPDGRILKLKRVK